MWVVSVDGHDKLCDYQNSIFPLGISRFIDMFSGKFLSLKLKVMPVFLRCSKGTETGKMASIHCYLMSTEQSMFEDPVKSIASGSRTTYKIERWWWNLHTRLEKYFTEQLRELLDASEYDPHNDTDRQILAYVYIPIVQRECEIFISMWNSHRVREQANLALPTDIPDHMFLFPDRYGGHEMGIPLSADKLKEVAERSGILESISDNKDHNLHHICEQNLPFPIDLESKGAKNVYLFLKNTFAYSTELESHN